MFHTSNLLSKQGKEKKWFP